MKFVSTRASAAAVTPSHAIAQGLASDGGLFVPERWFSLSAAELERLSGLGFAELQAAILGRFFEGDPLEAKLGEISRAAFDFPVPLKPLAPGTSMLELFHGPTCAFKDFGARFLAMALSSGLESNGREPLVVVATSGDTGGAVAAAFAQFTRIPVLVLYPEGGVSARQERQLSCWGKQVRAFAVRGSFDDCQRMVKEACASAAWRRRFQLLSANSINVGRLLPQMGYYAQASLRMLRSTGGAAQFIIPSGNLGNAVACLWAKKVGFPIGRVVLAHNANRAVPDYFLSGTWAGRPSVATLANAMDVGSPSNMERVFHLYPDRAELCQELEAVSVSDDEIRAAIRESYREFGEVLCPHTAVALHARRQRPADEPWIVVGTAHPAKFESVIEPLLGVQVPVPSALERILALPSRHERVEAEIEVLLRRIDSNRYKRLKSDAS